MRDATWIYAVMKGFYEATGDEAYAEYVVREESEKHLKIWIPPVERGSINDLRLILSSNAPQWFKFQLCRSDSEYGGWEAEFWRD